MLQNFTRTLYRIFCAVLICFLVSIPATLVHAASTDNIDHAASTEDINHSGYTEIHNAKELQAIANNPNGKYVLMSDISLSGIDWYPINFNGTLDGNSHSIYDLKSTQLNTESNITVDGNAKKYDTYFSGLFGQTNNAVIKNLGLKACDIEIKTDKNCFAACIAGYTENTQIINCSVEGYVSLYTSNKMCGVAGIAGFGYGITSGCQTDVTLVFVDENPKDIKCEQFLGGILASGYTDIDNCNINVKGYVSIHGYAHNGGIVGMHYIHTSDKQHAGYVKNNVVNGVVSFFENNIDRRAYCSAYIGEILNAYVSNTGNSNSFTRDEHFEYDKTLLPDACDNPVYNKTVTDPTCTEMGYTTYTCKTCGYSYIRDYIFPAHKAGEFKIVSIPTYTETGVKRSYCTVCGALVEEKEIPKLIHSENAIVETTQKSLNYKSKSTLTAEVAPEDSANWNVTWTSSDESVVKVDGAGNITATGRGTAVITCSLEDGTPLGDCSVTVHYSFWQWIIVIFLFGWIWY